METYINNFDRYIYVYEFCDNHAYVGLTYNGSSRNKNHLNIENLSNITSVGKHILRTGINPVLKILTDSVEVKEAIKLEKYYVEKYSENGWLMLNIIEAGGIGGNKFKWSKELCKVEAIKYNAREEFKQGNSRAYYAAVRHKWIDEICQYMLKFKKNKCYWTYERCKADASIYNDRTEYNKLSHSSYYAALRHRWISEICQHMNTLKKPNEYWTKEKCIAEASKYITKMDFKKKSSGAYNAVIKNG